MAGLSLGKNGKFPDFRNFLVAHVLGCNREIPVPAIVSLPVGPGLGSEQIWLLSADAPESFRPSMRAGTACRLRRRNVLRISSEPARWVSIDKDRTAIGAPSPAFPFQGMQMLATSLSATGMRFAGDAPFAA